MESFSDFTGFRFDGCGCCVSEARPDAAVSGCAGKSSVLTLREQDVLHRIRESSEKARELKRLIGSSTGRDDSRVEWESAHRELARLRETRSLLEKERIAAAEERMRILGHL